MLIKDAVVIITSHMGNSKLLITDPADSLEPSGNGSTARNAKKLVKLIFGSYSIILIALNLLSLAVSNGDLFADFTGGVVINLNDFVADNFGGLASYLSSLIASAIIFMGPIHYYAEFNRVNIIVVLIITYCLTGLALGRMFKHPAWGFMSGFAVMGSFTLTLTLLVSALDYVSASSGIPLSVSSFIYPVFEGIFGMSMDSLYFYSIIENGAFLGIFSMFWAVVFSPRKKLDGFDIGIECDQGGICKI